jgi:hypothetical protein
MTPQSIETLMADIEAENPLDVGDLAINEHDTRRLMANHFCEIDRRLTEHGVDIGARLEIMAAIAAHTMVENMVLQIGELRRNGERGDFRAWMKRHGMG